ncbi:Transposase [Salinivirga cyanobacteriivorans]|uniref:Transposase n=1 Tax=Salinivirga cyanobacteriivorans TaxID=1307839 RepID=A0A0S2HW54_9BACT|nr:IS1595-like element ISUnb1 family transposase [Salinivirga cyanobacteriivorans]ALO13894.1 Transposase [Salinivirga cyanobacteriivorans]ALO14258.1 Transposase [Salinivirga cyanobacteriivorans]ALO15022.1 Transposase [Salinivirga cyanobacteriivorans]ALO15143.1 Transposase [Salinivirga cyanobacteriivorans]ALO16046.1 Transposase [Salinivirga cyanobacteriivorans]
MELFKGQNLIEFATRFNSDEKCIEYLAHIKWQDGFRCVKCGHTGSQVRKNHSRTCNKCSHTESATANTLFHKVKFGVQKAFFICFEMATTTKSLSASYVGERFGVTEKTARLFMHKVREAMKSSGNNPMSGNVHIDEFVIGGKEEGKVGRSYHIKKKKVICAVELTDDGKVKRMYSMKIDNYSSKELEKMFDAHISQQAKVTTDQWKGYRPLMSSYDIRQIESDRGSNFKALHTMIHQVKSWIRTTYSWVSTHNINRYLDEFCYRLNRSQMKKNIFNNLVRRMVIADKVKQADLICS